MAGCCSASLSNSKAVWRNTDTVNITVHIINSMGRLVRYARPQPPTDCIRTTRLNRATQASGASLKTGGSWQARSSPDSFGPTTAQSAPIPKQTPPVDHYGLFRSQHKLSRHSTGCFVTATRQFSPGRGCVRLSKGFSQSLRSQQRRLPSRPSVV